MLLLWADSGCVASCFKFWLAAVNAELKTVSQAV